MNRRQRSRGDVGAFDLRRLNPANRAFAALVAVAAVPVVLLLVAGCGVLGFVAYRLSSDGLAALTGNEDLRPAVAFVVIFVTGLAVGGRALFAQIAATRRLVDAVEAAAVPTSSRLRALVERCGIQRRLVLVRAEQPFSFAYGFASPSVAISTGLVDQLSDDEILAVLEHERYHVRARDPLKVVIARTLMSTFFYLPVLRPLLRRYTASREMAADRGALAVTGRAALAGALYRTVAGPAWASLGGAGALGGAELLDDRVRHLETGEEPSPSPLSFLAIATTVAVLALLAGALLYTVVEEGGPSGLMRGRMGGDMDGMSSPSFTGATWRCTSPRTWRLQVLPSASCGSPCCSSTSPASPRSPTPGRHRRRRGLGPDVGSRAERSRRVRRPSDQADRRRVHARVSFR